MTGVTLRKHVVPLAVVGLVWGFCSAGAADDLDERPITVVFRYDDYHDRTPTPLEMKIMDAFRKRHIQCTFGVVPCLHFVPLSAEKAELIRKAADEGAVEIALHGYTHDILTPVTGPSGMRYGSEFQGIIYQEQERRIMEGRALLEQLTGRKIGTFIPPYNSYDEATLDALEKLGFTCLSASLPGVTPPGSTLKRLPETCGLADVVDGVKRARTYAHRQGSVVVALFHSYDYMEYDRDRGTVDFDELVRILDWVTAQKDVQVLSIGQACERLSDLSAERLRKNSGLFKLGRLTPYWLKGFCPVQVYFESATVGSVETKWIGLLLLHHLAIAAACGVVAFFAAWVAFPKSRLWRWVLSYSLPALLLLCLVYSFRAGLPTARGALVDAVLLGASMGIWVYRWRRHGESPAI